MARRRFRWTRRLYRQADSLTRFLTRHMVELQEAPPLVQRYLSLWKRHPQRDDPLKDSSARDRLAYLRDDIPF